MYSILLPTYMEYDNIGIIVWLIVTEMEKAGLEFEIIIVGTRLCLSPCGHLPFVRRRNS